VLEDLLDKIKEVIEERYVPIATVYLILFLIILVRVFDLQILKNDGLTSTDLDSDVKVQELQSTRGNIYDAKGAILASNKLSYAVTIEDTKELKTNEELNKVIYKLIKLLEKKEQN